ncbi:chemotaxis protein CheA [Methylophaga lonarensis MPL]|uniref:Chemotaxis protein CheA n=1 Tax=Methylophaga lonarensis MPL TaxID=1286106 RepID=M7PV18_9GAMM|nr:chemotaxis protein CheA [Methylophaga lonarensis]EMR14274.1 chemotaxis protein CheA [Methylophaga lonarensis MPL]
MTIDVSQFHQVFFEESFEGLDVMENGLLNLAQDSSSEAINTIFRAAHSIKGGAGTFGFNTISSFTHLMETLLDEIRNEQRAISNELTGVLLKSVDVLRGMLSAVQAGEEFDQAETLQATTQLQNLLDDTASGETVPQAFSPSADSDGSERNSWQISFSPFADLMFTGNDPVRMFRELNQLGNMSVNVDTAALPDFADLEPENLYLNWQLHLDGEFDKPALDEVFEWVEGDCELTIEKVEPQTSSPAVVTDLPEQSSSTITSVTVAASPEAGRQSQAQTQAVASIRVATDKIDALINMMGELVITQSMLGQIGEDFSPEKLAQLKDGLVELERNTRQLQEGILGIRMLPISFVFNRFPRLVHDLCEKTGKQVELKITGEQTELDKTVMESISDPLVHLVRNSMDHGLELPEVRRACGKSETGVLHLHASHQGGNIVIEITDDGAGLNEQKIFAKAVERGLIRADEQLSADRIHELIFLPGFSTAEAVSDLSGRGVGMDVVRKNILSLGGYVEVESAPGVGSKFTIRLPLTLAIMDGQTVSLGYEKFIIPLLSIVESVEIVSSDIKKVSGKGELYLLREEYIPVIR